MKTLEIMFFIVTTSLEIALITPHKLIIFCLYSIASLLLTTNKRL